MTGVKTGKLYFNFYFKEDMQYENDIPLVWF